MAAVRGGREQCEAGARTRLQVNWAAGDAVLFVVGSGVSLIGKFLMRRRLLVCSGVLCMATSQSEDTPIEEQVCYLLVVRGADRHEVMCNLTW